MSEKKIITVIRKPEKINQEYSELIISLGNMELKRLTNEEAAKKIFLKVKELSQEMTEAQAEIKRKEQEKTEAPTPAQFDAQHSEGAQVQ